MEAQYLATKFCAVRWRPTKDDDDVSVQAVNAGLAAKLKRGADHRVVVAQVMWLSFGRCARFIMGIIKVLSTLHFVAFLTLLS